MLQNIVDIVVQINVHKKIDAIFIKDHTLASCNGAIQALQHDVRCVRKTIDKFISMEPYSSKHKFRNMKTYSCKTLSLGLNINPWT